MPFLTLIGSLFFKDFTVFKPQMRLQSWDKQFAGLKVFPNVLITPHSAFLTNEALRNISDTTIANIKEFASGLLILIFLFYLYTYFR